MHLKFNFDKIQTIITNTFYIAIGLTSYYKDSRTKRLKSTKFMRFYAAAVNLVSLTFIILSLHEKFSLLTIWDRNVHPVFKSSTSTNLTLRILAVSCTIMHRWQCGKLCAAIEAELAELEQRTQQTNFASAKKLNILFYLKFSILIYMYLSTMVSTLLSKAYEFHWYTYALVFFYVSILNMVEFKMFQYFQVLWRICHLLHWLNFEMQQLLTLCHTTNLPLPAEFGEKFNLIFALHSKLLLLLKRLQIQYASQMIMFRCSCTTNAIVYVYYCYIMIFVYKLHSLYFVATLFLLIFDVYLTDFLTEITYSRFDSLELILRAFGETEFLRQEVCYATECKFRPNKFC